MQNWKTNHSAIINKTYTASKIINESEVLFTHDNKMMEKKVRGYVTCHKLQGGPN